MKPESNFKKLQHKLEKKPGVHDAAALAAFIGRNKIGAKAMAARAAAARKSK